MLLLMHERRKVNKLDKVLFLVENMYAKAESATEKEPGELRSMEFEDSTHEMLTHQTTIYIQAIKYVCQTGFQISGTLSSHNNDYAKCKSEVT